MTKDPLWKFTYNGFEPAKESLREALCTLGNGYFGTRGAAPESVASSIHYPGTYAGGIYNRLKTHIAGRAVFNEDMVNCPNWLFLTFRIGSDDWFVPSLGRIILYHQQLDMKRGILTRDVRVQNRKGRITRIQTKRLVHMSHPHYGAIQYIITPQNYSDWITVRHLLDGVVLNSGVARYRQLNSQHLELSALGSFARNGVYLSVITNQSRIEIAYSAGLRFFSGDKEKSPSFKLVTKNKMAIGQQFKFYARQGVDHRVEKIVSLYTSRDEDITDPIMGAVDALKKPLLFNDLFQSHQLAWEKLWDIFDVSLEGDIFSQRALRFHIFHLLQTASLNTTKIDAGFPARGLHGESYRGHIFWDEIFALPFYNLHLPRISRALILYRWRRLDKARKAAKREGYAGAMFPWQSASTGEEETQIIHLNPLSGKWNPDYSNRQRHVSFAIAYNVWSYFKDTNDSNFMLCYGAELFLSIAQFAASLARYSRRDKRYHSYGIMGPDEFHEKLPGSLKPGLKDNAYSNVLISWVLTKALELIKQIPKNERKTIMKKIRLKGTDLKLWEDISRKMNIIMNKKGIISQFSGYFNLEELDWSAYRTMYGDIQRMDRILKSEGKSPDAYQIAKQADVLMLFYLFHFSEVKEIFQRLGYRFDKHILKQNYVYYLSRTTHGSTLSKVVYCLVALYLKKHNQAWQFLHKVFESDIYDVQTGATTEGIHTGVMAGSWNIVIRGLAGIYLGEDKVEINPHLPSHWRNLCFKLFIRGQWVLFRITHKKIVIMLNDFPKEGSPLCFEINNKKYYIISRKKLIVIYK